MFKWQITEISAKQNLYIKNTNTKKNMNQNNSTVPSLLGINFKVCSFCRAQVFFFFFYKLCTHITYLVTAHMTILCSETWFKKNVKSLVSLLIGAGLVPSHTSEDWNFQHMANKQTKMNTSFVWMLQRKKIRFFKHSAQMRAATQKSFKAGNGPHPVVAGELNGEFLKISSSAHSRGKKNHKWGQVMSARFCINCL